MLHLGDSRGALNLLGPQLLADEAAGLAKLIDVTERLGRRSVSEDAEGPLRLDLALSAPVVDLLTTWGLQLPDRVRLGAARLVHEHLEAASADGLAPDTGLDLATELPDILLAWVGEAEYGDVLGLVIGSLALLGRHLADRHDEFLAGHARNHPHEVAEAVESPRASGHLGQSRPDLLLRLAGLYYVGIGLKLVGEAGEVGRRPRSRLSFVSPFEPDGNGEYDDDDAEGVRDHDHTQSRHLSWWPLGNNQSNPALGPFAALLDAHPAHGLRLIGSIVDAATSARARLEFGPNADTHVLNLDLSLNGGAALSRFTGPATVWFWHRRTSVGPGPALSALMALRAWGVDRIRNRESPAVVRQEVLAAGTSLAFPSVVVSILVDRFETVTDELDMFLAHPLVWRLENARHVHELGGPALDIPDSVRLSWTMSDVAMHLVLRGDEEDRERLRQIGGALVANHAELREPQSELLARRWATELDINQYRAEPHDNGIAISVSYDPSVMDQLASAAGQQAVEALRASGLMMKALDLRDGRADLAEAAQLWRDTAAIAENPTAGTFDIYPAPDILSAAAAAVVLAAHNRKDIQNKELRSAARLLLDAAHDIDRSAPPELAAETLSEPIEGGAGITGRQVPETVWDMGADRSIASALPILLRDEVLRTRTSLTPDAVAAGIRAVATSQFFETRERLVRAVQPMWELPCETYGYAHTAALAAARRLITTAGYGPVSTPGYGRPPATLPEPIENTLRASGTDADLVLDIAAASYGVRLLAAGEDAGCEHGEAAAALLDVLVDYDERVWPRHYARHHFHRTGMWRTAIDTVLAERILRDDDEALSRRLRAFAHIGEDLRELLQLLATNASTPSRIDRLHAIWPQILDHLLPDARVLTVGGGRRERPYHRHVEELDGALLLVPPEEAKQWPAEKTFEIGARWLKAYKSRPHVADRAILFIGRMLGLCNDLAIALVLNVLGDDVTAIRQESSMAVAFLQVVLSEIPDTTGARRARALLDRLAAAGDDQALSVQQQLEA